MYTCVQFAAVTELAVVKASCDKCIEKSICLNGMDRNSFNFFYGDECGILLDLRLIHV
jgi:hypothetical protein